MAASEPALPAAPAPSDPTSAVHPATDATGPMTAAPPAATESPTPAPAHSIAPKPSLKKASANEKSASVDPLASLQSLWGSLPWGGAASAAATAPRAPVTASTSGTNGSTAANDAAGAATEWLTGASIALSGAMQGAVSGANAAVAAAGNTLRRVDHTALEGGLAHLRDASDQLARDVRAGVAQLSADAVRADATPAAILAQLRDGTREAFELLVDGDAAPSARGASALPPWHTDALPERERPHAHALRERMLRLAVDAIYSKAKREQLFLAGRARADGFEFDPDAEPARALAVLDADPNVRRLRAGLVPAKLREADFWSEYFWHVRHTRGLLLAHDGKLPTDVDPASAPDSPDTLFGTDAAGAAAPQAGAPETGAPAKSKEDAKRDGDGAKSADGARNWDDEIDAIFDAKHD